MTKRPSQHHFWLVAGTLLAMTAVATAGAPAPSDLVPEANRASGKLKVAISLAYPPMEYTEPGSTELLGFDIDLARAIADRLGLVADFQNVEFPQLIPQVLTGRSDMILTAFSDKPERRSQLDFVDYFMTGSVFFSTVDHRAVIATETDLCGKTIAVATGTSWVDWAENVGKAVCPPDTLFNVIQIPTLAEHLMQIRQDRAQASVIGIEGLADLNRQKPGTYYQIGRPGDPSPYGIAFAKENTELRDAVLAALDQLAADGTYTAILDRHGLSAGGVTEFKINGAAR